MTERDEDEAVERALLEYLAENPRAMDRLEGIAEWWLERPHSEAELAALLRVLRRLVERGVLETVGSGEATLYRLKRG